MSRWKVRLKNYGELVARNRRLETSGMALAAVGAGLALGAGVIWGLVSRRQRTSAAAGKVSLRIGAGGGRIRF